MRIAGMAVKENRAYPRDLPADGAASELAGCAVGF